MNLICFFDLTCKLFTNITSSETYEKLHDGMRYDIVVHFYLHLNRVLINDVVDPQVQPTFKDSSLDVSGDQCCQ